MNKDGETSLGEHLRKVVEEVRADGVVTAEESAKLVALIKDFMAEASRWSLETCPACKRMVPVSSLKGASRRSARAASAAR